MTNLKNLELRYIQITDAGLVHIKGLTNLQHLHLYASNITDAGIAELQKAYPNCKIHKYVQPKAISTNSAGGDDADPVAALEKLGADVGRRDNDVVMLNFPPSTKVTDAGLVHLNLPLQNVLKTGSFDCSGSSLLHRLPFSCSWDGYAHSWASR